MKQDSLITTKQALEAIRQDGNPYWNIDPTTGKFLQNKVTEIQATRVLEIGTSIGLSALYFVETLIPLDGHLYTIESHAKRFEEAQKNFAAAKVTSFITQVKGHAPEILNEIEGTFDLLFFDATKMEHILYYQTLKDRLNTGGYLIADNVLSHAKAMTSFVEAIQQDTDFTVSIEDIGTGKKKKKKK